MKSKLLIVIIMCFLLFPYTVFSAKETSPIDQLNYLSDEALQLTKSHRYEDAKIILDTFSDKFSNISVQDQNFTMDELRIVTIAHNEAVEATSNASMDPDERINRVTKFRLVIDAISSTKQPLWTEMKEPMLTVFSQVKAAALNGEREVFYEKLNSFLALYEVVYPSMKIDVSSERIQKLDTRINFVDQYRVEILTDNDARQELLVLETELQMIFDGLTEDEADPSLWWVIISTGSIIILTLSYVGWRKYRGEHEKSKNRSR